MANVTKRKERVPIGGDTEAAKSRRIPLVDPRDRLNFPKDPKYHRVWITDVRGQVDDYLDSGFDFCNKDEIGWTGESHISDGDSVDTRVAKNVGRAGTIDNAIAYLLQMRTEDYKELQKLVHTERQRPINDIKRQREEIARKDDDDFSSTYGSGVSLKLK